MLFTEINPPGRKKVALLVVLAKEPEIDGIACAATGRSDVGNRTKSQRDIGFIAQLSVLASTMLNPFIWANQRFSEAARPATPVRPGR